MRTRHHFCDFLPKMHKSNNEKTLNKPESKDILQNNWSIILESLKVINIKERLRTMSERRKTEA